MKDKLGRFVKGIIPWNKGTKGVMKPNKTSFKKGMKKLPNMYVFPKGKKNISWKGGTTKSRGYVFIRKPNHPFNHNGYVKRARLVMEKKIGRYLTPVEIVHHKNGIKDDDRPKNLQLLADKFEHRKFHNPRLKVK